METKTQAQNENPLPHERLYAYMLAREVLTFVIERKGRLGGLLGDLADQLMRSTLSSVLNIAEAAGRRSPRDRKSRFAIARGEMCEVAAALDCAHLLGRLDPGDLARAKGMILRVTRMLASLASWEALIRPQVSQASG